MRYRLLRHLDYPGSEKISVYRSTGGYEALRRALAMKPTDVIDEVRRSGLRGRGGAGFLTGVKWSLASVSSSRPKYLICNADEGEPGTFKDRPILEQNPHLLIEGMVITSYALQAQKGYIYIRGEYPRAYEILDRALSEAYDDNFLGKNILRTGWNLHLSLFRNAGAYICGEETALIESIEGKRGQPRIKPPYPVVEGLFSQPTIVHNVETLANIPFIVDIGGDAYAKIGSPNCPGPKLFSVSGHVRRPGVYELPMGTTLREIIYQHCGGIREGRKLKAVIPGGVSSPVLNAENIDCPMDFMNLPRFGSVLGSGAVIVFDETVDLVKVCHRAIQFYYHESCGKCTPCREGVWWMESVLEGISTGQGSREDIDLLDEISRNITGKTFCALGESAATVMKSFLKNFRGEFEAQVSRTSLPLDAPA